MTVKVMSPYFVKVHPKKRKKPGPCGPDGYGHLGLIVFGFIVSCSQIMAKCKSGVRKLCFSHGSESVEQHVISAKVRSAPFLRSA